MAIQEKLGLVMLIDDNDTDNFISKRIIELTGFAQRIEIRNSGKSALEYLTENEHNLDNLPDLVFLDINMPIVDGFIFLYEFDKMSEQIRQKCKIVVLSSSDNKRDIDRMLENQNVIKFLTKPLSSEALQVLREVL
ncbi:response regulator [Hugenholtzia roseola]|uniref:response regulator n=1 Tax=Hugenholtzia roseola TaxID=1002 RepID=UPI0004072873|nr:response regulator [Hugenholtzia roseola]